MKWECHYKYIYLEGTGGRYSRDCIVWAELLHSSHFTGFLIFLEQEGDQI